jgi:hypothetical protein
MTHDVSGKHDHEYAVGFLPRRLNIDEAVSLLPCRKAWQQKGKKQNTALQKSHRLR